MRAADNEAATDATERLAAVNRVWSLAVLSFPRTAHLARFNDLFLSPVTILHLICAMEPCMELLLYRIPWMCYKVAVTAANVSVSVHRNIFWLRSAIRRHSAVNLSFLQPARLSNQGVGFSQFLHLRRGTIFLNILEIWLCYLT